MENIIWVPGRDAELQERANGFIRSLPNMYHIALEGGKRQLGAFRPTVKLYILAHGHDCLPLFVTESQNWTADQLADLLISDGLSLQQRDIELLVCSAGESVNTKDMAEKITGIREQFKMAQKRSNINQINKLTQKYKDLKSKSHPQSFEDDPERLLIPLAAQLSQALKSRRFTNFRIISYKCTVAQFHGTERTKGHVFLDLKGKGGRNTEGKDYRVSADDDESKEFRVYWY